MKITISLEVSEPNVTHDLYTEKVELDIVSSSDKCNKGTILRGCSEAKA